MYQRNEFIGGSASGSAALSFDARIPRFGEFQAEQSAATPKWRDFDLVVDLGTNVGSKAWWRGLATCTALCAGALALFSPGVQAIAASPAPLSEAQWDEARAQAITPLAFGGDTGRRMASTEVVEPLADTPERPRIELAATLGRGDSLTRVLERSGVSSDEATDIEAMIARIVPISDIEPGTVMDIVLGRREHRSQPRPVEALSFRARFDLRMEIARAANGLQANPVRIAVDDTPLRIRGKVGSSLYRSARAAGAPPSAIQEYLRAIGTHMSVSNDIGSDATFDLIIEHRRAETGEVETGRLLYAGVTRGDRETQLLRWSVGGREQWFEASGVGRRRGEMIMPVPGRITSNFGMRRHPILRYRRMHTGMDIAAGHGTPIRAAASGVVNYAGRNGGYGNYVRIAHGNGLQTAYAHMSRFAVSNGARVAQGQVIGYVGSTGVSTGPHLHYELMRGGQKVNPRSVRFIEQAQLAGDDLRRFRSTLANLLRIEPGAAMARTDGRDGDETAARDNRSSSSS